MSNDDYYYLFGFGFMTLFFVASLIGCIFAPDIYQFTHVYKYKIWHWFKYGKIFKTKKPEDIKESKIKKAVRKMNVNEMIRLLEKYGIEYDIAEVKKGSFNVMLRYYKKVLNKKQILRENKELDKKIFESRKIEQEEFDYEAYKEKEKADNERFKANFNRSRNIK